MNDDYIGRELEGCSSGLHQITIPALAWWNEGNYEKS
jgi:hypothetical protein